jgi:four helix bundle protein
MAEITSFKDLIVWQKSFQLSKIVYELSEKLPQREQFGLISQLQRCVVSIPSNIAEGQQRNNIGELGNFWV